MLSKKNNTSVHEELATKDYRNTCPPCKEGQTMQTPSSLNAKPHVSRITINLNCGFGNTLHLRGEGAGLSWERGIPLKNINADTWIWETDRPFTQCSFKVLLNDRNYETGENHVLKQNGQVSYVPQFS